MKKTAQSCSNMTELRELIDLLDRDLINLLGERAKCIDRAIEIKRDVRLPARIDERVEQVVANARRNARNSGADPDLVESLWRQLVEWSIAREELQLSKNNGSE